MTVLHLSPRIRHNQGQNEDQTPIAALHERVKDFDPVARAQQASELAREQACDAALMADSTLTGSFHTTLAHVIASTTWSGRVPVPENGLTASAVSFLGTEIGNRAWWLHYTRRPTMQPLADRAHVLTLIAPCECGTYIDVELTDEDSLIVLLDELDTPTGTPVPCDHSLRIRRTSHSDNRHASTSPPP